MQQIVSEVLKICIDCKDKKQLDNFYLRKGSKDGHHNYCKECHNKRNKKSIKKWQRSDKGKEKTRLNNKIYRESHGEESGEYNKIYARKYQSSGKGLEQRRIIDKRKRLNPKYRVDSNFSRTIRASIKDKNNRRWSFLVGYSIQDLILHLEKKFDEKMSWNNYGSYWHIDHIIPRSSFSYSSFNDEDFKRCWSLSNLQPLEAKENIRKSNHIL